MIVKPGTIFANNDTNEWFEVLSMKPLSDHANDTIITFKNLDAIDLEHTFVEWDWGTVQCLVGLQRPGAGYTTTWRWLSPEESTYEKWDEKNALQHVDNTNG